MVPPKFSRVGLGLLLLVAICGSTATSMVQAAPARGSAAAAHQVYLPLVVQDFFAGAGLYGKVTLNGAPISGVGVDLRFYNGAAWSTYASTTTDALGLYSFTGAPGLGAGQIYYVRYLNPAAVNAYDHRLGVWGTRSLTSATYTAGANVMLGVFDIADVEMASPTPGATVALPATFRWTVRASSPTDSYKFNVQDKTNPSPAWATDSLGYVGSYSLNALPSGFAAGTQYAWTVGITHSDGSYGAAFWMYYVTFSNAGGNLLGNAQGQAGRSANSLWLSPDRLER